MAHSAVMTADDGRVSAAADSHAWVSWREIRSLMADRSSCDAVDSLHIEDRSALDRTSCRRVHLSESVDYLDSKSAYG
jgi:hypothetical protein